jgi:hypothetical protein
VAPHTQNSGEKTKEQGTEPEPRVTNVREIC